MQIATLGVGDNPLRGFRAAQGVVVEELFVSGNVDSVDVAASCGAVRIEERKDLVSLERPNLGNGKAREVDREFERRKHDIARDGPSIRAGRAPRAVLLGSGVKSNGKNGDESGGQKRTKTHILRMTSAARCRQTSIER